MSESTTTTSGSSFEWPAQGEHVGAMRGVAPLASQAVATPAAESAVAEGAAAQEYVTGEAVTAVPDDAIDITADATVADEAVGVAPDGTVIDTSGETTVVSTSDGVEVSVGADGQVRVDADFTDNSGADISTLAPGSSLETESGTVITRNEDGSITIEQPNGQTMTIHEDGTVDVDLPSEYEQMGSGAGAGSGSGGGGAPTEEEPEAGEEAASEESGAGEDTGAGGADLGGGGGPSGGGSGGGGDTGAGGSGGVGDGATPGVPVVPGVPGGVEGGNGAQLPSDTDIYDPDQPGGPQLPDTFVPETPGATGGEPTQPGTPGVGSPGVGSPGVGSPGVGTGDLPVEGQKGDDSLVWNPVDTDGDGIPDYRDTDSDNDGIPDAVEAVGNTSDGKEPGLPEEPVTEAPVKEVPSTEVPDTGGPAPVDTPSGGGGGGGGGGGDSGDNPVEPNEPTDCDPRRTDGTDFTVDLSDLRDDAKYIGNLIPSATELAGCWESVSSLVQHWGLWMPVSGTYQKSSLQFASLYEGASKELQAISEALTETARRYEETEASGVRISGTINK